MVDSTLFITVIIICYMVITFIIFKAFEHKKITKINFMILSTSLNTGNKLFNNLLFIDL
jgi:hypothetical protein